MLNKVITEHDEILYTEADKGNVNLTFDVKLIISDVTTFQGMVV